jgi:hypothetical protein
MERNGCLWVVEGTDWRNMVVESGSHKGHLKLKDMKMITMACAGEEVLRS